MEEIEKLRNCLDKQDDDIDGEGGMCLRVWVIGVWWKVNFIEPILWKREVDEVVWPMRKRQMLSWPIEK